MYTWEIQINYKPTDRRYDDDTEGMVYYVKTLEDAEKVCKYVNDNHRKFEDAWKADEVWATSCRLAEPNVKSAQGVINCLNEYII